MKSKSIALLLALLSGREIVLATTSPSFERSKFTKKNQACECAHFHGELLDSCMKDLPNKRFIENFRNLKEFQRKKHLWRSLNSIQDYTKFLDRFSEKEWIDIWNNLSPEEQKFFPKTRDEQALFLNNLINECKGEASSIQKRNGLCKGLLFIGGGTALSIMLPGVGPVLGYFILKQGLDVVDESTEKEIAQIFNKKKIQSKAFEVKD